MWIDTHAHIDQEEFDEDSIEGDRQEVLQRATTAGVEAIVAVGISAASSQQTVQIARQHHSVYAAVGIQPNYCAEATPGDWDRIVALASDPEVVAIGETGLDRHWDYSPLELQQDYFDRHLRLAQQLNFPFIVHTRKSADENLAMLREARSRGSLCGVMHSFDGSEQFAAECLELGLYISFAGMVTFKKSDALRAVAATIPADRILVETDSPYLSPHPKRGKRNEPANVVLTAECVAKVREVSLEDFAAQTTENARRLFGLKDKKK